MIFFSTAPELIKREEFNVAERGSTFPTSIAKRRGKKGFMEYLLYRRNIFGISFIGFSSVRLSISTLFNLQSKRVEISVTEGYYFEERDFIIENCRVNE